MPKGRPKGFDEAEVLERAMQTFWREGYAGASMSILLKDMGISRQSLYDTYGDKRTLYLKAVNLYIDREVEAFSSVLNGPPPVRPRLLEIVNHFREMALGHEQRGCLMINAIAATQDTDEELRKILNDALQVFDQTLHRSIQSAIDLGEISPRVSAQVLTRGFMNACMGFASVTRASLAPEAIEDMVTFLTSTLVAPEG